mmetsp:Transcript_43848/g.31948  ORF Transcript_43848/g.31948 Transcript_43848/m.31948 type:complete len:283 (+) Transcript_43848:65-913(+)
MRNVFLLVIVLLSCMAVTFSRDGVEKYLKDFKLSHPRNSRRTVNSPSHKSQIVKRIPLSRGSLASQGTSVKRTEVSVENAGYFVENIYSDNMCGNLIEVHGSHINTCDRFSSEYSRSYGFMSSYNTRTGYFAGTKLNSYYSGRSCLYMENVYPDDTLELDACYSTEWGSVLHYFIEDGLSNDMTMNSDGMIFTRYQTVNGCTSYSESEVIERDIYDSSTCYLDEDAGSYYRFDCSNGAGRNYYGSDDSTCSGEVVSFVPFLQQDYCQRGSNAVQIQCTSYST